MLESNVILLLCALGYWQVLGYVMLRTTHQPISRFTAFAFATIWILPGGREFTVSWLDERNDRTYPLHAIEAPQPVEVPSSDREQLRRRDDLIRILQERDEHQKRTIEQLETQLAEQREEEKPERKIRLEVEQSK